MTNLSVAVWSVATAVHVLHSARFILRRLDPDATPEARAFASALFSVAALSAVVHAVILTTGLSLAAGLFALAILHAVLWLIDRRSPVRLMAAGGGTAARLSWAEIGGATVLIVTALSWIDLASRSAAIDGPDAPGYHVPAALNFAHGAALFGLPATQHLYPLAGSAIAAWFLVPLESPLVVDLAQVLPFAVLVTALVWLFQLMTGRPGLAWAPWLAVLLFSTPLFRSASQGSADLWFASGFVAALAVLTSVGVRRGFTQSDCLLAGGALGLLVGAKTTGAVSAAVLVSAFALARIGQRVFARRRVPRAWPAAGALVAGLVLALGAGGIWLVRNWVLFGSPIAPAGLTIGGITIFEGQVVEPTTYYSVLGDWSAPAYDVSGRTYMFVKQWLGIWFVPALFLVVAFVIDVLATAVARQARSDAWRARAFGGLLALGGGAVLIWLLIGAPWTSLEWTKGHSLRYALPVAAMAGLLALVGLFPISWRFQRPATERLGLVLIAGASLVAVIPALMPSRPGFTAVPGVTWLGLVVAGAFVLASALTRDGRRRPTAIAMVAVLSALAWAPVLSSRDAEAVRRAEVDATPEQDRFAGGARIQNVFRAVFLHVRAFEQADGRSCRRRRFFTLVRFDEPLSLQDDRYESEVYYAARDVAAAGRAGPIGPCDFIVTTETVTATEKGQALERALLAGLPAVTVARPAPFVVLARGSR